MYSNVINARSEFERYRPQMPPYDECGFVYWDAKDQFSLNRGEYNYGERISFQLEDQYKVALHFISKYLGQDPNTFLSVALSIGASRLHVLVKDNKYDTYLDRLRLHHFDSELIPRNVRSTNEEVVIEDPDLYNTLYENRKKDAQKVTLGVLDYFIQAFLDSYNENYNPFGLTFPDCETVLDGLYEAGNNEFLEEILSCPFILGFSHTQVTAVNTKEELESGIWNIIERNRRDFNRFRAQI